MRTGLSVRRRTDGTTALRSRPPSRSVVPVGDYVDVKGALKPDAADGSESTWAGDECALNAAVHGDKTLGDERPVVGARDRRGVFRAYRARYEVHDPGGEVVGL